MNVLLLAVVKPPINTMVCEIASIGFVCPGVDKHSCCTVYSVEGIRIREKRSLCHFKSMRNSKRVKTNIRKVNPLKQSKRTSTKA